MRTTKMLRIVGDELDRITAEMQQASKAWDQAKAELGTHTTEWNFYANEHRNEMAMLAGAARAVALVVRLLVAAEVKQPATSKPRRISTRAKAKRK